MTGAKSPAVVRSITNYRNATPFPWMSGKSRMVKIITPGRVKTFDAMSASGKAKRQRTECRWLSPRVVDWNMQQHNLLLSPFEAMTC